MANTNLSRTLGRTIYSITRRYGGAGTIYRRVSEEVDLLTGNRSEVLDSKSIRWLTRVSTLMSRELSYTPAMMQAMRNFAWQGGAGQDSESAVFLILLQDLQGWGEITPTQWLRYEQETFQVVDILRSEGGWILSGRRIPGTENSVQVSVGQGLGIGGVSSEEINP